MSRQPKPDLRLVEWLEFDDETYLVTPVEFQPDSPPPTVTQVDAEEIACWPESAA